MLAELQEVDVRAIIGDAQISDDDKEAFFRAARML